jgi:two-component system sensor histidine kinase KdpD
MIIRPVRQRLEGACRLRSALLTSISHDLKTPLAAVLGAAGTLRSLSDGLDQHAKADLLATIIDEAERLNRFIANLLDMTKLESGAIVPNAAMHDLGEIIGSALERSSKILVQHRVEVDLAKELPMVEIDPVLFEQVTCWIMRQSMLRPELPSESRAGTIGTPVSIPRQSRGL